MKYFLTLLGVAVFITLVFAFNGNFFEKSFSSVEVRIEKGEGILSAFGKGEKGNGDVVDEERKIGAFTEVSSSNAIKVKLIKGNAPKVIVRTDSNLQDNIKTEVKGGDLMIYIKGSIRKYSEMTVFVTFTELDALDSSSASEISCEDKIATHSLSIDASSASNIALEEVVATKVEVETSSAASVKINSGSCEDLEVDASSASSVHLYRLQAQSAEVEASSAADVELKVIERISAKASSGADINYKGNPERLNIKETSGGDISKK